MMKKRIIAMILCLGTFFSTSVTAWATEIETVGKNESSSDEELLDTSYEFEAVNTWDIISPIESPQEQIADFSNNQIEDAIKKLNDTGENSEVIPYATTWKYLSGFRVYKQSKNYYCVVASCKAAMQYLTGSSDSQSTIASDLGTTTSGTPFGNAKTYLNSHQEKNTYVSKGANTALSTMKSNFYDAINTYDAPPIISVKLSTTNGWAYNTSGHTMCISGARSDKAYFRIADPYIQWVDSDAAMSYKKSASNIHTAILDRGNGYIY